MLFISSSVPWKLEIFTLGIDLAGTTNMTTSMTDPRPRSMTGSSSDNESWVSQFGIATYLFKNSIKIPKVRLLKRIILWICNLKESVEFYRQSWMKMTRKMTDWLLSTLELMSLKPQLNLPKENLIKILVRFHKWHSECIVLIGGTKI